ncbi:MAG: flagellar basal body P-ring protein FlgI [Gemmataceae bacterium]|nr:flagellar basal body P-ring protein FlgI [Gemmataceae bacterium]
MRHAILSHQPVRRRWAGWLLAAVLLGPAGCTQIQTRGQAPDGDETHFDLKEVQTIGDCTEVANPAPLQLSGVGLVTGLEGTGGGSPSGTFRSMLEADLLKKGVRNVRELLDAPDKALVLVTALVPPGARRGDPLDIQVSLPPGSKVTSLRGGYLQDCALRNYDSTRHLSPQYQGSDKLLPGHILARARGSLLVGCGHPEETNRQCVGCVWDGGAFLSDRPFYLVLKNDQKFARIANAVANRINSLFPDDARKRQEVLRHRRLLVLDQVATRLNDKFTPAAVGRGETARAAGKDVVCIHVPYTYRLNPERYLQVALLIPLREAPEARSRYRHRLVEMLREPRTTIVAALRLEALGKESQPLLKEGLKSEYALVRFACAEALAYLECGTGAEELGRLAERHGVLRAYCLAALAALDEPGATMKLNDMLANADAEVRYGAFKALRLYHGRDDDAPEEIRGEVLGDSFRLHQVAPESRPLVHACTENRGEIVCFGDQARLVPPFKLLVGPEFTVTAEPGDDRVTVGRFILDPPSMSRKQCSCRLEDILRKLVELGGSYSDALELLRQAERWRCLTAPVVFDKVPMVVSMSELANEGKDPRWLEEDAAPARDNATAGRR